MISLLEEIKEIGPIGPIGLSQDFRPLAGTSARPMGPMFARSAARRPVKTPYVNSLARPSSPRNATGCASEIRKFTREIRNSAGIIFGAARSRSVASGGKRSKSPSKLRRHSRSQNTGFYSEECNTWLNQ